jgi:hypothetical protein
VLEADGSTTWQKAVGSTSLKEGLATIDEVGLEKELAANFWNPVYRADKRLTKPSENRSVDSSAV